jgi:asparagine synthase (glutamine-hydrolysing)
LDQPDRTVGLGHARLSIIDLTTGDQPIASADERMHIIANGEFYGYEAIRTELERAGTICAPVRTARSRCISTGIWAAMPAPAARRVRFHHLGRDQPVDVCGARPVRHQAAVLRVHQDTLYFASEVKRCSPPAFRRAGIPRHFWQTVEQGGYQARTAVRGSLFQVPPGHYLIATDRHIQVNKYWDFDYPLRTARPRPLRRGLQGGVPCRRSKDGAHPAACRRAGRLLSQRRARFLSRPRPRGAPSSGVRSAPSP